MFIYFLSLLIEIPFLGILIIAGFNYLLFILFFEFSVGYGPEFSLNIFKMLSPLIKGDYPLIALFFFVLFVIFMIYHFVMYWVFWTGLIGITLFFVIFGSIGGFFSYIFKLLAFLGLGILAVYLVYRYVVKPLKNKRNNNQTISKVNFD